jgi:hypothetical protein
MISELAKLKEIIKNVFISFDKDASGFIDPNELKAVSKDLGRELDDSELETCMKDLDLNHDGKISLDEFTKWWLSGRQGLSNVMRKLLSFKIQALKFADQITGTLKEIINDAGSTINNDISTNQLTVNINKVEEAGFSVYYKVLLLSPELKDEYTKIRGLHTFGIPAEDTPIIVNYTMHVKNGTMDEITKKLNDFMDNPENELPQEIRNWFSIRAEGHDRLCLGVALPQ